MLPSSTPRDPGATSPDRAVERCGALRAVGDLLAGGQPACGLAMALAALYVRALHSEQIHGRAGGQRSCEGLRCLGPRRELAAASATVLDISLCAFSGRLGTDEPGQRLWRDPQPHHCARRPYGTGLLVAVLINGAQERCAEPRLRSQDRATQLCAAGREPVPGAVREGGTVSLNSRRKPSTNDPKGVCGMLFSLSSVRSALPMCDSA